jgi:3-deoxy-D-manno-octulosonic-acid transferase
MYWIYSALLGLALLLTLPYWLMQMSRHGKYRAGLRERLGQVPARLLSDPDRPRIWVHAVSVGEVRAVSEFIGLLQSRFPQHQVVISTTTSTGQKLAQKTFGPENVFYFPLDFAFAIRPYLRALRPELVVLAETEFWPNFIRLTHARGARMAVVNARISDRSWPRYLRFRSLYQRVLRHIDLFMAQTEEDAKRLRQIGAPADRVFVSGNLKFDVPTPPAPPIVDSLHVSLQESGAGPVIVCGSTVDEEEPILLRAFENVLASYQRAVMILAPRHPERFTAVAEILEKLGIRYWRRSLWSGDPIAGGVLLIDNIGELAALYSIADIAFVGGSLVPRGGHNIIEPAQHRVAILVGPHTENFRDIIRVFQRRNAVRVVNPVELPLVLMELISNAAERAALGRRAAETLESQTGASKRTAEALQNLLQPISNPAGSIR